MRRSSGTRLRWRLTAACLAVVGVPASVAAEPTAARPPPALVPDPAPAPQAAPPTARHPPQRPHAAAPASSYDDVLWQRTWDAWQRGASMPARMGSSLSQQVLDELSFLGNELGTHLDTLTLELLELRFDGRRRRMQVGVGTGDSRYLSLRVSGDLHFTGGMAKVSTQVQLGLAGHKLSLELPEVEVEPTSFRGERGVMLRLPLLQGSF